MAKQNKSNIYLNSEDYSLNMMWFVICLNILMGFLCDPFPPPKTFLYLICVISMFVTFDFLPDSSD